MNPVQIDPALWSTSELVRYGEDVVHELALTAVGTVTSYQFLIGRCLLAMKREHWYENQGCSSVIHYAVLRLGLPQKKARLYYHVAHDLMSLPALSNAAALGQIPWGKLREISRKASKETEHVWIALAKKHTYSEIERLVARTEKYDWPRMDEESDDEPVLTELRCRFEPQTMEMFDHVQRKLSEEAGRPLSATEVFSQLCAERLVKGHPDEKLTKAVEKSVKSRRAYRRQRDEFLVQQARDLAAAMNLHGQSEGPGPGREQEPQAATNVDGHRPGPGRRPEPQAGAADCGDCPETGQRDDARDHDTHGGAAERPGPGQQHEASDIIVHRGEASRPEPGREARALADMYAKVSLTACPGVPELKLVQKMADVPLNSRLKFNPNARFATPAQREELLRRDGYRCCVPGCPHHLWLEAHHLIEFCLGGLTGWKFLRMVCRSCHRNIHSGVLTVTLEKDGTLRFRDRKGRDLRRAIDMEVAQWLNFWQGWRGERVACHMRRVADGAWDERAEPAA